MYISEALRLAFVADVEQVMDQLCSDIARLDKEESVEDIMRLLYALRIAANAYGEHDLKRRVEKMLAIMLNHSLNHNPATVNLFYDLAETMVYPSGNQALLAA